MAERLPTAAFLSEVRESYEDHSNILGLFDKIAFSAATVLTGPKGIGKSLAVATWAARAKVPLVTFDCSEDVRRAHLYGSFVLRGSETPFVLGPIGTAVEIANEVGRCILNLEECNSLVPQMQKALNPITDWRRRIEMPEAGLVIALKPEAQLWVVGSMNTSQYGGEYELNEDLKSRLRFIAMDYPGQAAEAKILKHRTDDPKLIGGLLTLAAESRQEKFGYALSTRDLTQIIDDVKLCGLETALWLMVSKFEPQHRSILTKRIVSIFDVKPKR